MKKSGSQAKLRAPTGPLSLRSTPTAETFMPNLLRLSADELRTFHVQARQRYDAFAKRGVKLNLTRGKPSARQLDLCNELLSLPGPADYTIGNVDCRNYGELQGLADLRTLLAPIFGVTPERVIIGDNAS
jgi:hypothetical protein